MSQSLYVRDGNGTLKELEVISGSNASRLVPVHSLTGSIATTLSSADLSTLTSSISAVSSAVGLFNQQLYQALTGGPVSMSVDIVAGDVNAITGSVDRITTEVAKLTVLSGSNGLKVYTLTTASVNLVNTSSLTASISNFPPTQSVSFAASSVLTASISNFPPTQNVTASIVAEKSTTSAIEMYVYNSSITSSAVQVSASKSLIVNNQTNASLFLAISASVDASNYSYIVEPYGYYESDPRDSLLIHSLLLSSSATLGRVAVTKTS